jgi:hypothetical protein
MASKHQPPREPVANRSMHVLVAGKYRRDAVRRNRYLSWRMTRKVADLSDKIMQKINVFITLSDST